MKLQLLGMHVEFRVLQKGLEIEVIKMKALIHTKEISPQISISVVMNCNSPCC